MDSKKHTDRLIDTVKRLSDAHSYRELCHQYREGDPLPSGERLAKFVELCRAILFPGFYGKSTINHRTISYQIGINTERVYELLSQQVLAGLCFVCNAPQDERVDLHRKKATEIAIQFIEQLPEIRRVLATDVQAAYLGDPAAVSTGEVIFCYPAIRAISNYRIANTLYKLEVPLIPRMITEMAHSETGIDIHPAAVIGEHFTIDHGTGVVIGATSIIGSNVKIYQGVTLGAKSFTLDENGNPVKGVPRHPILEDDVIIYSNATILGRITIGKGAVVGGNIWVTEDVAPGERITQKRG